MRSLLLLLSLIGFWLLLSGQFESTFLVGSGVISSALAVFCCHRLGVIGEVYQPVESIPRFLFYLPWLIYQIVLASLDVTRHSWSLRSSIQPRLVKVPHSIRHPLAQTLLANSITLTPGTVTIDVTEDQLLVHALTDDAEKGVLDGSMTSRIQKMIPTSGESIDTEGASS